LPQILIVYLGHGNIELVLYPRGDGLYYLSLAFQGMVLRQAKLNLAHANVHRLSFPYYFSFEIERRGG
jgi:hypothetical protein